MGQHKQTLQLKLPSSSSNNFPSKIDFSSLLSMPDDEIGSSCEVDISPHRSARHPSSGTRGSISPRVRKEMASVFDWMNATEPDQEIDAVPLWFQLYMETFKDEVVCEVSSKVVQSLGVVLDNKLSKLKIQNNNNQQQNRNKMTAKEVFQMKRRRNAARRI